jgi:uncharacterized protein (DUF2249 family)
MLCACGSSENQPQTGIDFRISCHKARHAVILAGFSAFGAEKFLLSISKRLGTF